MRVAERVDFQAETLSARIRQPLEVRLPDRAVALVLVETEDNESWLGVYRGRGAVVRNTGNQRMKGGRGLSAGLHPATHAVDKGKRLADIAIAPADRLSMMGEGPPIPVDLLSDSRRLPRAGTKFRVGEVFGLVEDDADFPVLLLQRRDVDPVRVASVW